MYATTFGITLPKIIFGNSCLLQLPSLIDGLYKSTLYNRAFNKDCYTAVGNNTLFIVYNGNEERKKKVEAILGDLPRIWYAHHGEPDFNILDNARHYANLQGCNMVLGIGGGSILDIAKALALLLKSDRPSEDYAEIIGKGVSITKPGVPYIAIPTTAGTGSEVTKNAVLYSALHARKVSIRSEYMLPVLALVDPELCYTTSPQVTASTGMDALTQVIEPFLCNNPHPLVDILCRDGIYNVGRYLIPAYQDGMNAEARAHMSLVSLWSGIALSHARLGAVHGIAGPLGGMCKIPHGAACAALLPHALRINISAMKKREPHNKILQRCLEIAHLLHKANTVLSQKKTVLPLPKTPEDLVAQLLDIQKRLKIASLRCFGFARESITDVALASLETSSMKGNPIKLDLVEVMAILEGAY